MPLLADVYVLLQLPFPAVVSFDVPLLRVAVSNALSLLLPPDVVFFDVLIRPFLAFDASVHELLFLPVSYAFLLQLHAVFEDVRVLLLPLVVVVLVKYAHVLRLPVRLVYFALLFVHCIFHLLEKNVDLDYVRGWRMMAAEDD